jgi:hypothetical protein
MTHRVRLSAILLAVSAIAAKADTFGIYLADSTLIAGTASYASGPGVSLANGGGLVTRLTPDGTVNPSTFPLGLTSGNMTVAGGSPASASSSSNLATGALKALADSTGPNHNLRADAEAQMVDVLHFTVGGGGSAAITIHIHVDGTVDLSGPNNPSFIMNSIVDIGGIGGDGYFYQATQNGFAVSTNPFAPGNFGGTASFTNESTTGFDFTATYQVSNGQSVGVNLDLQLESVDDAIANFMNTDTFSLSLPSNVSFTSDSGVFLTGNATTGGAVPEPGSIVLLLTTIGFAGIGFARRKRKIA